MIFASTRYVEQVELRERELRTDYENRLRDKDSEIRRLRAELAGKGLRAIADMERLESQTTEKDVNKFHRNMEAILHPGGMPLDWQGELSELLKEEEGKDNGISE